jgi:hypothetical protein
MFPKAATLAPQTINRNLRLSTDDLNGVHRKVPLERSEACAGNSRQRMLVLVLTANDAEAKLHALESWMHSCGDLVDVDCAMAKQGRD